MINGLLNKLFRHWSSVNCPCAVYSPQYPRSQG